MSGSTLWRQALLRGLGQWCDDVVRNSESTIAVVHRLRPRCPLLILSGATPGPFYHSHPHVPAEFDHLSFDLASQTESNIRTIGKIARSAGVDLARAPPQLVHWVSENGDGFESNSRTVAEVSPDLFSTHGMRGAMTLGAFATGGNVSDRRFLLETFGMAAMVGHPLGAKRQTVRIDIEDEYDEKYFMPYVPAYLVQGLGDLVVFSLTAATGELSAPMSGVAQVETLLAKLPQVLGEVGASFDDVVLCWNRVADLDANEEAVLMTRSRLGFTRPLAESVLEVTESDPVGCAPDGTPLVIEYIVAAWVPRCG